MPNYLTDTSCQAILNIVILLKKTPNFVGKRRRMLNLFILILPLPRRTSLHIGTNSEMFIFFLINTFIYYSLRGDTLSLYSF